MVNETYRDDCRNPKSPGERPGSAAIVRSMRAQPSRSALPRPSPPTLSPSQGACASVRRHRSYGLVLLNPREISLEQARTANDHGERSSLLDRATPPVRRCQVRDRKQRRPSTLSRNRPFSGHWSIGKVSTNINDLNAVLRANVRSGLVFDERGPGYRRRVGWGSRTRTPFANYEAETSIHISLVAPPQPDPLTCVNAVKLGGDDACCGRFCGHSRPDRGTPTRGRTVGSQSE